MAPNDFAEFPACTSGRWGAAGFVIPSQDCLDVFAFDADADCGSEGLRQLPAGVFANTGIGASWLPRGRFGTIKFEVSGTPQCLMIRPVVSDRSLNEHRDAILAIATRHGARNVRIFGSVTRGDAYPDSDIDLLIDLEPGRTLLDHVGLRQDLEELLGRRVDIVEPAGLHHLLRDRVLAEAVAL